MILDIDCVMPPGFDVTQVEGSAHESLKDKYPKNRKLFNSELQVNFNPTAGSEPTSSSQKMSVQALQFFCENEKNSIQQLVQFRTQGFSFNRMAPYKSLDEYLPEIERVWKIFTATTSPKQITLARLRYVNRILLPFPTDGSGITLLDFIRSAPQIPLGNIALISFLSQQIGAVLNSSNQVHTVLLGQPIEDNHAPIIFDNAAVWSGDLDPNNWSQILNIINELRLLKNEVFRNTLTDKCLAIYQKPKEQTLP
ncbi:MAG TPA: TIGR04255 family protein [Verrucomicrobiae bacterium]